MNLVQVRVERVRQRSVKRQAYRENPRRPVGRGVVTRQLDFAADHLAAARFRREEDDQVVGLADLLLDLLRPGLANAQPLIDEHAMAGLGQAGHDVVGEGLIRFDVPFVAEEDARGP